MVAPAITADQSKIYILIALKTKPFGYSATKIIAFKDSNNMLQKDMKILP